MEVKKMIRPVAIRTAKFEEVGRVVAIERESFPNPWSRSDFLDFLNHDTKRLVTAVDRQGRVCGYAAFEFGKRRIFLRNVAVDGRARRLGIGTQLLQFIVEAMHYSKRTSVRSYTTETNLAAQLFQKSFGFKAVSPFIARGFFHAANDSENELARDAYIFEYSPELRGSVLKTMAVTE